MAIAEGERVIQVEGLSTWLGQQWVHRDLDLEAYRNEMLAVVGASGSGKSALLQQIVGLLRPQTGYVEVLGIDVHRVGGDQARYLRQRWGIVFQQGALFSALNVFDNVAFPLRELARYGEGLDEAAICELTWLKLGMVKLGEDDAWKLPAELSGGMAKRAALARALTLEAELLFLDEPTAGLDPVLAREFNTLIAEVRQELGLGGLIISHDLHTLASLSDRVAILTEGRILAVGTLEEVAQIDHPFVRDLFLPSPAQERIYRLSHRRG